MDWELREEYDELLDFTRHMTELRHAHPVLRRRRFFSGRSNDDLPDIAWLRPDGQAMGQEDWARDDAHALGVFLF
jgi:isoamylase